MAIKHIFNFRYNKSNQLIAKYCCDEDITNAKIIRKKYKYKNDVISHFYTKKKILKQKNEKI